MPLEMKYFTLNPRSKFRGDPFAEASRAAMYAYANSIDSEDKELANSLKRWADVEAKKSWALPGKSNET